MPAGIVAHRRLPRLVPGDGHPDRGYAIAMTWGAGILLVTAVPVAFLVNARARGSSHEEPKAKLR
jgi:hypothetical protein